MRKIVIPILVVLAIAIIAATFYPEPFGNNVDMGDNNLTNADYISANYFNGTLTGEVTGSMNWTKLQNYPAACPGSGAITQLNDSVTCSDLWVDVTGDTMTGNLTIEDDLNVTGKIHNSLAHMIAYVTTIHEVASGGTWYNLTFNDTLGGTEGITFEDNRTVVITNAGHYTITFGMGYQDNAANPSSTVAMRITNNGSEMEGSYIEQETTKQNADIWSEHTTHAELLVGDQLTMQYISEDTTVNISQDGTYAGLSFHAYGYIQEIII